MLNRPDDNVWALLIVGQANGLVTVSHVHAPVELAKEIRELLQRKAKVQDAVLQRG